MSFGVFATFVHASSLFSRSFSSTVELQSLFTLSNPFQAFPDLFTLLQSFHSLFQVAFFQVLPIIFIPLHRLHSFSQPASEGSDSSNTNTVLVLPGVSFGSPSLRLTCRGPFPPFTVPTSPVQPFQTTSSPHRRVFSNPTTPESPRQVAAGLASPQGIPRPPSGDLYGAGRWAEALRMHARLRLQI